MATPQKRVAAGVSAGGQFASHARSEAQTTLGSEWAPPADGVLPQLTELVRLSVITAPQEIDAAIKNAKTPIERYFLATNRNASTQNLRALEEAELNSDLTRFTILDHPQVDATTVLHLSRRGPKTVRDEAKSHALYTPRTARERAAHAARQLIFGTAAAAA